MRNVQGPTLRVLLGCISMLHSSGMEPPLGVGDTGPPPGRAPSPPPVLPPPVPPPPPLLALPASHMRRRRLSPLFDLRRNSMLCERSLQLSPQNLCPCARPNLPVPSPTDTLRT